MAGKKKMAPHPATVLKASDKESYDIGFAAGMESAKAQLIAYAARLPNGTQLTGVSLIQISREIKP